MATSADFMEFVCEQVKDCGSIRYRKMFGEYMVYVNDKPIFLVCDNTVFVKIRSELDKLMQCAEKGFPYDGAKEHYILDIENTELVKKVSEILEPITPVPKKK